MSPGLRHATLLHVVQAARRRSTIIEVAAKANVAFSTVSRVLNGGYASPEVRELPGAVRRRDRLLERDHRNAVQRSHSQAHACSE